MNKKICYQACLFLFMFFMGVQEIYSQKDAKEWNKLPIKALLLAPHEPGPGRIILSFYQRRFA